MTVCPTLYITTIYICEERYSCYCLHVFVIEKEGPMVDQDLLSGFGYIA